MNENTDIYEKLINVLFSIKKSSISVDVDLWDIEMIAFFLKKSPQVVRERIACQESFPKAIRIPTKSANGQSSRKGQPLYRAKEVIAWAVSFQEKF